MKCNLRLSSSDLNFQQQRYILSGHQSCIQPKYFGGEARGAGDFYSIFGTRGWTAHVP